MRPRVLLLALACFAVTPSLQAKECVGVTMPDQLTVEGKKLLLNGMGVREATFLQIDVYVAGLYLEKKSNDGTQIARSEQLKEIRLKFVRDVARDEMREAIGNGFKKTSGDFAKIKDRVKKFESMLPEFKKGDSLTLIYRPGLGLEVVTGAGSRGTIAGADFMRALFLIWLGGAPPNPGLKSGLLGGQCGS